MSHPQSKSHLKHALKTQSPMEILLNGYLKPRKLDINCINDAKILRQNFSNTQIESIAFLINLISNDVEPENYKHEYSVITALPELCEDEDYSTIID